jgi:RNA 2',3'-cyclic 3'-phosphodiesterase
VRLFLAINFPDTVREAVAEACAPLREAAPGVRWVKPELLHLTVKFFGDQPDEIVPALRDAIAATAARHRPMELVLEGVGAFPNLRRPRVVWTGVEPSARLELLFHDTESACDRLGFPLEGKVFRPHVTIGRVRPGTPPDALRPLATAAKEVRLRESVYVETLDLMASDLSGGGPRYVLLHAAPLRDD